jgi:uncharacterized membrane protein
MHAETSVDIGATPAKVWKTLVDVERWPTWTKSVSQVQLLSSAGLAVGARVRIRQPRLPVMDWDVIGFEPESRLAWTAIRGGVATTATHQLRANEQGATRVVLSIDQKGPLAGVVGLFTSGLTRRYLELEAQGLKVRCEA